MVKKISIVLPVYNGEKYLCESIESVLGQTYRNWELIIVDDCSTDRSPIIMREYGEKDSRIKVFHNKKNEKLPMSLNIGFANASGDYFTWTSDDNKYKPQALERMQAILERTPDIGLVYADMDYIDEEGNKTNNISIDVENLFFNDCVGACFLYRASVAREIGGYQPEWFLVEDYEYWLRLAEKHVIYHLSENLYEYRYHKASLTKTKRYRINEQLHKLRMERLNFILARIQEKQKAELFIDMCLQNMELLPMLKSKFYKDTLLPEHIRWIEQKRMFQPDKQVILFGAGEYGKNALTYFGNQKVAYFVDNNANVVGTKIEEIDVIDFERLVQIYKEYQIVVAVDARKISSIVSQLEKAGIREYITYLEMDNSSEKSSVL